MIASYADYAIHGVLPLVADGTGIRFAKVGQDHPHACVTAPAGLPDFEMTLHKFANYEDMDAWLAKAKPAAPRSRLFVTPELASGVCVLEVDRAAKRLPGDSLNEVIGLVDHPPTRVLRAPNQNQPGPRDRWQEEIAVLESCGYTVGEPGEFRHWIDMLPFWKIQSPEHQYAVIRKDERLSTVEGLSLAFKDLRIDRDRSPLDVNLREKFKKEAGKIGLRSDYSWFHLDIDVLDAEHLTALEIARSRLDLVGRRVVMEEDRRTGAERIAADVKTMAVLRDAVAGSPLVDIGIWTQMGGATGASHKTVAPHAAERAVASGALELAWEGKTVHWPDVDAKVVEVSIWVPSEAGKAIAAGEMEEADRLLRAGGGRKLSGSELNQRLREAGGRMNVSPEFSALLETRIAAVQYCGGFRTPTSDDLCTLAAGACQGIITYDYSTGESKPREQVPSFEDAMNPDGNGMSP